MKYGDFPFFLDVPNRLTSESVGGASLKKLEHFKQFKNFKESKLSNI
jgi:hypothetical protein